MSVDVIGTGARILVVDDDEDLLVVMALGLEDEGFEVYTFSDPVKALNSPQAWAVDAAVLDVNMPKISGYEVLQGLRAIPGNHDLPILFASAMGTSRDRVQGLRHGADGYLTKPFALEELALRLRRLTTKRPAEDEKIDNDESNEYEPKALFSALDTGRLMGLRLGRYEVRDKLGDGAMGVVLKAWDPRLRRDVAIKTIRTDRMVNHELSDLLDELLEEAATLAKMNHPHVVTAHDAGTQANSAYLVLEYVEGTTLGRLLKHLGRLSEKETAVVGLAILRGLGAAHQAGIIHYDLKPDNVLLGVDGTIKVTDFGVSHVAREPGGIFGTLGFIAPEVIHGDSLAATSDLFSVGATLYLCLTGRLPFRGKTVYQFLLRTISEDAPSPLDLGVDVSPAFSNFIMGLLAKEPEDRTPSAAVAESLLLEAVGTEPEWKLHNIIEQSSDIPRDEVHATVALSAEERIPLERLNNPPV